MIEGPAKMPFGGAHAPPRNGRLTPSYETAEASFDRGRPAVEAIGIFKYFDGKPANSNVSLSTHFGEIHAVLGENGAGKSTLISVLAGVYRPDAGEVIIDSELTFFRSPRDALNAGIGVVYQDLRLIENLSVLENVLLGTGRRPTQRAREQLLQVAADAGFNLNPNSTVRSLDIAHRQQVEILKLLMRDLKILIFDEPTAVLGEAQVSELFSALRAFKRQGKAIIIVTHRLREVRSIADRLTILRGGEVRAFDRTPESFTDAQLTELMVGPGMVSNVGPRRQEVRQGAAVLELKDVHAPSISGSGLRGVSLAVHAGEVLGVAGVRGNGQREIAEVAAGLRLPARGEVTRQSSETAFIPEDRLGMGLSRNMTIGENLALRRYRSPPIAKRLRLDRLALRKFAGQLIERFRIPGADSWQVTRLSGGGLQRVVVARELERDTALIVASQPTRGLDIRSTEFVRRQLVDAAQRGCGVLVVSEDLDELIALADRIVVLYEGAVASVATRGLYNRHELGALMLGGEGDEAGPAQDHHAS